MAYYPAQDTKIVTAKTEDEMKAAVATAMADGYFPISDTAVWDAKLVAPTEAYRQTMVKYTNTDAQYIANMYAAFQSILEGINSQLASANSKLQQIVTNTNKQQWIKTMEEQPTRLYGECAYLLDKIWDKCESMHGGWDELIDHIASIDDTAFGSEANTYHLWYKFLMHVYWRIHRWTEPQSFNQISRKQIYWKVDGKSKVVDGFSIWNYDHKMYIWALRRGFSYGICPRDIEVPESELTPAELKRFSQKVEEESKNV